MGALKLRLDGTELLLPDDEVHYLSVSGGRLGVATRRPAQESGFGYLVSQLDSWWLHTDSDRRPVGLRLDGRPVRESSVPLPDGVPELTIARRANGRNHPTTAAPASPVAPRESTDRAAVRRPRGRSGRRKPDRQQWVIGRVGTGANIEIDDPLVRAQHALLEVDPQGRWWISEADGRVFVDGARVLSAVLEVGKTFVIGQTTVAASPELLAGGAARAAAAAAAGTAYAPPASALQVSAGQGKSVDINGVTVYGNKGVVLLDDVDLHIAAGEVVAVVGPSGAGKSSLVKLLLGEYEPACGTVSIDGGGHSFGAARPASRREVRYVPQTDDLYPDLTVAETLAFAARFRAERDVSRDEEKRWVSDALSWLGLEKRADARVKDLSGGERRRVSIGTELAGRPQLLLLDEPTSGLDLGKDRDIVNRLHTVSANLGCTIIMVTHSVANLRKVDRIVLMGRGGRLWYSGPPVPPSSQGYRSWADWLVEADREPAARPAATTVRPAARPRPIGSGRITSEGVAQVLGRQAILLGRRGAKSLGWLFALPLAGTAIAVAATGDGLRPGPQMAQVLSILITVAALTGAGLTYLDLVHERDILRRDWRVGVGAGKLLAAKVIVYGIVSVILSTAMAVLFDLWRPLPPPALGIAPLLLLVLALSSTMVSSMGLGLLISAYADTLERAVTYNTFLAVCQVALNGALFKVPLLLSFMLPARLGLGMVASYADLNAHRPPGAHHDPLFGDGAVFVPLTLGAMVIVGAWAIVAAVLHTERRWRG